LAPTGPKEQKRAKVIQTPQKERASNAFTKRTTAPKSANPMTGVVARPQTFGKGGKKDGKIQSMVLTQQFEAIEEWETARQKSKKTRDRSIRNQ